MNRLRAEILAIGDELTSGQRLDTNSQWLAQRLGELGVRTMFHTIVGDDLAACMDAFQTAIRRSDLLVATGGLGPTADDLTRDAIAAATHCPLELRPEALAHIENLFARRYRTMPQRNRVQAMFPRGSRIIPNPHGTAPGIDLYCQFQDGHVCRIFALPGVPAEMTEMWNGTVADRLRQEMGLGTKKVHYRQLKLFGLGESDVEALLPNLIERDRDPLVGITVSRATITLRISTLAETIDEANHRIAPIMEEIREHLGEFIFGEDDDELEDIILRLLSERRQRVGLIEIGQHDIAAKWFRQKISESDVESCVRCMRIETIEELCKSSPLSFERTNIDWTEIAERTADDFVAQKQSDWVLVVGPYPKDQMIPILDNLPELSVAIVVCGPDHRKWTKSVRPIGHPDIVLHRIAKQALDVLRKAILESDFNPRA